MESIIVAVLGLAGTLAGSYLANRKSAALLAYRLEQFYQSGETGMDKLTVSEAVTKYDLTRREHTILKQLMSGADNAEICSELVITPNTLKKHILNIYRKLGIKNRVQLFKMVKEFE